MPSAISMQAGASIGGLLKVVQERLGDAIVTLTADVYGHLFPRADDGSELAVAERALVA